MNETENFLSIKVSVAKTKSEMSSAERTFLNRASHYQIVCLESQQVLSIEKNAFSHLK